MVKHGPCYHCGVTSTPLWRNGPPEKPVLCNACGSRWRTKGTLANYTPLHAQTEFVAMDANKVYKAKAMPIKKDTNFLKRKNYDVGVKNVGETPNSKQHFNNVFEKEGSKRSSSGSAMSYAESCGHFGAADGSESTGPTQSTVWDSLVPSRKRTCLSRPKHSSVEKLTKELQSILDKQQQSFNVSMSSEEDVLLQSGTLMDSFEIGHGGFLLKYSNFQEQEKESEASFFSIDKKAQSTSDTYSAVSLLSATSRSELTAISNDGNGRVKKITAQAKEETTIRNKSFWDELRDLICNTLPLTTMSLKDVVNHEVFIEHLTPKEQNQLMKDLPSLCPRKLLDRSHS